jgi:tetratricopeptide (TPR) repeat protein
MKKIAALAFLVSLGAFGAARADIKLPKPSPGASVKTEIGTAAVTIDYHRPGVKGRKIWGELVPYGQVWRLGANNATTITFSDVVKVEGKDVPAGTYGLFAIPAQDKWTLILNKQPKQWGSYFYKAEEDVLRFDVQPQAGPFTEWMVFEITPAGSGKAVVEMAWENLRVPFRVEVDADAVAWKSVDEALAGSPTWEDYQTAAHWALEKDQRLDEAMTWIDKASAMQESFWNHETKARLLQKAGKVDEAVTHLDKAMKLAEGKAPKEYIAGLEKLKGEWRARG